MAYKNKTMNIYAKYSKMNNVVVKYLTKTVFSCLFTLWLPEISAGMGEFVMIRLSLDKQIIKNSTQLII